MQVAKLAPSSLHWKVAAPSPEEKLKFALVELVGLPTADESSEMLGAVVSIVQVKEAGELWLLAASTALTKKVCELALRPLYVFVLVQAEKAPPSSSHWNVAVPSVDVKPKVALVALLGLLGVVLSEMLGGVVSIVQVKDAGVLSLLAASIDLTWKVCEP